MSNRWWGIEYMDFSNLNIEHKHKKKLSSLGIKNIHHLLSKLEIPLPMYMRTSESKLVEKFKAKYSFIGDFENELIYFLTAHKKHLTRVTFIELARFEVEPISFFEDYDEDLDEIETEDSEDYADYLNVDSGEFPVETLLIGCLPQNNSFVEYETLKEVIQPFEETILQNLRTSSLKQKEGMQTLKKMLKVQGWPSDYPIFISKKNLRIYPEIVSLLKSMALLVLKHT